MLVSFATIHVAKVWRPAFNYLHWRNALISRSAASLAASATSRSLEAGATEAGALEQAAVVDRLSTLDAHAVGPPVDNVATAAAVARPAMLDISQGGTAALLTAAATTAAARSAVQSASNELQRPVPVTVSATAALEDEYTNDEEVDGDDEDDEDDREPFEFAQYRIPNSDAILHYSFNTARQHGVTNLTSQSSVFTAEYEVEGHREAVAIKRITMPAGAEVRKPFTKQFNTEVRNLKRAARLSTFHHVVTVYDHFLRFRHKDVEYGIVVMQLADGRNLVDHLQQGVGEGEAVADPLPPEHFKDYVTQLLRAYWDLHKANVFHRDVKPENVLLASRPGSDTHKLLLCDFALSRMLRNTTDTTNHYGVTSAIGSAKFIAPEILKVQDELGISHADRALRGYTYKADLWSLGCLLFNMAYLCEDKKMLFVSHRQLRMGISDTTETFEVRDGSDYAASTLSSLSQPSTAPSEILLYSTLAFFDFQEKLISEFTFSLPLSLSSEKRQLKKVVADELRKAVDDPESRVDKLLADLIQRLAQPDPQQRLLMTKAVTHPFVWEYNDKVTFLCELKHALDQRDVIGCDLRRRLDEQKELVLGAGESDWTTRLAERQPFIQRLESWPRHMEQKDQATALLKCVRNGIQHVENLISSQLLERRNIFRNGRHKLMNTITELFPGLFIVMWECMCDHGAVVLNTNGNIIWEPSAS